MFKSSKPFVSISALSFSPSPEFSDDSNQGFSWLTLWRSLWSIRSLLTVIAVVGCVHVMAFSVIEMYRVRQSHQSMAELHQEIAAIEAELVDIQAVIAHGQDDTFIEQLARQQGFVYPDEMLIRSVDAQGNAIVIQP